MKLLNAFSANMIASFPATVTFTEITPDEALALIATGVDIQSAVGHADTAAIFGEQLGVVVEAARVTVALESGEVALLGQYRGPRLAEGARTLPEGATIQWLFVSVR